MPQMFNPGPNTTSLYFSTDHRTIIYVANIIHKNNVSVSDLDVVNDYILSKNFDDKMDIWLDFRFINSINNRAMRKIVNHPKNKTYKWHAITGFNPSMDLKFRCLAGVVIDEDTEKKE